MFRLFWNTMEDIILSPREHKVLKKFQKRLQKRFNVQIEMPTIATAAESDVIFVTLNGEVHNRERVKKFLSDKVNMTAEKVEFKENILLVTLSDSEEETTNDLRTEENIISDENICSTSANLTHENLNNPLDSSIILTDSSVCIIETHVKYRCSPNHSQSDMHDQTICIDEHSSHDESNDENEDLNETRPFINYSTTEMVRSIVNYGGLSSLSNKKRKRKRRKTKNKVSLQKTVPSFSVQGAGSCEVSSTTEELVPRKRKHFEQSELLSKNSQDAEFTLLRNEENSNPEKVHPISCCPNKSSQEEENDVIVIDSPASPIRQLRPVVIDGSNVAIEHGRLSQSYSAKGIQLAVQYFLDRGHSQVTAFVPRFRRHCNRKQFPTTDAELLDDLAKNQHVVFTPSRKVNGKCIASYDDRFIVQLASTNGGVIVSNDNYRDLLSENDSFKEAIENRLLMFCFVGDIFMIPSDPLGRNGPSLNEFLTFPPESSNSVSK